MQRAKLFAGNSNPILAEAVVRHLDTPLGKADVGPSNDAEVNVEIHENVRGMDCVVIQSTSSPANSHLMELLIMIDALRRSSARRVTAVVPYYGYARQDRRVRSARVPITGKVGADRMVSVGVDRVLTVEMHREQSAGFVHMSALQNKQARNYPLENL